jgi:hypothetical protein
VPIYKTLNTLSLTEQKGNTQPVAMTITPVTPGQPAAESPPLSMVKPSVLQSMGLAASTALIGEFGGRLF